MNLNFDLLGIGKREEWDDNLYATYTAVIVVSLWWMIMTNVVSINQIKWHICSFFKIKDEYDLWNKDKGSKRCLSPNKNNWILKKKKYNIEKLERFF